MTEQSLEQMLKSLETDSEVRFKFIGRKLIPLCDSEGICTNKAYAEVYPSILSEHEQKELRWSYQCKTHFAKAQKKLDGDLPYCRIR